MNIPVLTETKFLELVKRLWLKEMAINNTLEEIVDYLIQEGFPKYEKGVLNKFVKESGLYFPTICVDIGDKQFIWVVSGSNAILVNKIK